MKEDGFIMPKVRPVFISRSSVMDLTLLLSPCQIILPLLLRLSSIGKFTQKANAIFAIVSCTDLCSAHFDLRVIKVKKRENQ